MNYRRLEDINERRRVRVLVVGSVIGWLATLTPLLFFFLGGSYAVSFFASAAPALCIIFFLAFPFSFAYALLRHRVFDVRIIIRQGLQYALMRGVLLGAVPVVAGILLVDLFLHGDRPIYAVLGERGWIYVTLGVLAVIAHVQRQRWMEALDRRFFRDRCDAQHLLREVVEEICQAAGFEPVAPRVAAHIEIDVIPGQETALRKERSTRPLTS